MLPTTRILAAALAVALAIPALAAADPSAASPAPAPVSPPAASGAAAAPAAAQVAKARQVLQGTLKESLESSLQGWETQYVEKPSFPFVVDKVARQVRPQAAALIQSNIRAAQRLATKPQVRMQVINALSEAGIPGEPDNATVDAVAAKLQANCAQSGNFTDDYATLAIVGWGSGDHEAVKGDAPDEPGRVADRLLKGVAEQLFAVARP